MMNTDRYPKGAYEDGYETGFNWKDSYRPGGPWRFGRAFPTMNPKHTELYELYEREYHEWHAGFLAGYANNPNKTIKD